jgi:SAM-dependent methyltransferase
VIRRALARFLRFALERDTAFQKAFEHEVDCHKSAFSIRDGFFGAKHFLTLGYQRNEIQYQASDLQLSQCVAKIQQAWVHLGLTSPHFSVISDKQFLPENLAQNIDHFWASGDMELSVINGMLERHAFGNLAPKVCVEYGCGVGRVTNAIAPHFRKLYGYDISSGHLEIAKQRAEVLGLNNCQFLLCNNKLLPEFEPCDFFYSRLVLQHNPPPVIFELVKCALRALTAGGIAIFQVPTYIIGYRFNIEEWITAEHPLDMQMHCLPQDIIFSAVMAENCELLEIQHDDSTGVEGVYVSNVFIVRKKNSHSAC